MSYEFTTEVRREMSQDRRLKRDQEYRHVHIRLTVENYLYLHHNAEGESFNVALNRIMDRIRGITNEKELSKS